MEIINNFLPQDQFDLLVNQCNSLQFRINNGVSGESDGTDKHDWQLSHWFYQLPFEINNETFYMMTDILRKLDPTILSRAKLNINYNTETIHEHGYHNDCDKNQMHIFESAVFYLNTNDGYTKFEDGSIVESVANRLVKFPASLRHTGSSCTNAKYRMVLNLLYIPQSKENK
tara:strand:+ start:489 stop:1004 length:516 start_codon:yes stop_codon:yes gene_type:complete